MPRGSNRGDNIQGRVGWSSGQQDLVEDVPCHCRGVGRDGLKRCLPTKLLYHFMYFHAISSIRYLDIIVSKCTQNAVQGSVVQKGKLVAVINIKGQLSYLRKILLPFACCFYHKDTGCGDRSLL